MVRRLALVISIALSLLTASIHAQETSPHGGSSEIQDRANGAMDDGNVSPVPAADETLPFAPVTAISAVWANDGEDKVTRDELRASSGRTVKNSLWDGSAINLFGFKNEVVNFNLILEAASAQATNVSVSMSDLNGPNGSVIRYSTRAKSQLFDWTTTEIELFYVRYLQIVGASNQAYGTQANWQEPTFPARVQCQSGTGCAWTARPAANKFYPDIAVPIELVPSFTIAASASQAIWADIYIPKTIANGSYTGSLTVSENGVATRTVPIMLTVRNGTLPDAPSAKTMLDAAYGDLPPRYGAGAPTSQAFQNEILEAHRHKVSIIDDNFGQGWSSLKPAAPWLPFLNGNGFTAAYGYAGPGVGVGQDVFGIGTYGGMTHNSNETQSTFTTQLNGWESWFEANSPSTERFVYLCDEDQCGVPPTLSTQLQWWQSITGPGRNLHTLATQPLKDAVNTALSDPTSTWPFSTQMSSADQANANAIRAAGATRRLYAYNGQRPGSGSMVTEDEGTSMREIPWGQYKKQIDRWFIWQSTYYKDIDNYGSESLGQIDLFNMANTFGTTSYNAQYGYTQNPGFKRGVNGNGLLFYPGTDLLYPNSSYGIGGPIVSLRLKYWRRGIQDVDYLTLANAINPAAVASIVSATVPAALWENQCFDLNDCSYYKGPVSWSNNPDDWEAARAKLADIIDPPLGTPTPTPVVTSTPSPASTVTPGSTSTPSPTTTASPTPGQVGQLTLTVPLALSPSSPVVNQPTTASFTVQNTGGQAVSVSYFFAAARDPSNKNVDFPVSAATTLQPGQSYAYSASETFATDGTYTAWPAYYDGTNWIALDNPMSFTVMPSSLTTGLQGYWKLNDGSGTSTLDASPNANAGTLSGAPLPTWTTDGRFGNVLLFAGDGGFVSVPTSASLNDLQSQGGGGMSVIAWIYPTSLNPNQALMDKGAWQFGFYANDGIQFNHFCSSKQVAAFSAANSVPLNQWDQVVATWNGSMAGSGITIYVNGVPSTYNSQDCSGSVSSDSGNALTLGATYYNGDSFVGKLHDLRVYNRVLSANEVTTLYTTP